MKLDPESLIHFVATSEDALPLIDASVKLTLFLIGLLLAATIVARFFNVSAARRASLIWVGALAIPVVAASSFFVASQSRPALVEVPVTTELPAVTVSPGTESEPAKSEPSGDLIRVALSALELLVAQKQPSPPAEELTPPAPATRLSWPLLIWLSGIGLVVLRLLLGIAILNWRARRLATIVDAGAAFESMRFIARDLGLRRLPTLMFAQSASAMPMTWGALRHKVLLPAAANSWPRERLELVLQHELSHVRRRDCLAGWSLRLLLAPAWFHPLAWMINRKAIDLRERACDDAVVELNGEVDRYAHELIEISRRYENLAGAVAMARPRRLRARIRAMYCPRLGRKASTRTFRGSVAIVIACCIVPMCFFCACQTTEIAQEAPESSEVKPRIEFAEPKQALTPKPVFKKGDKRVTLRVIEVTRERADAPAKGIHGKLDVLRQTAEGKSIAVPAAVMAELPNVKGADLMALPAFPAGRKQGFKIARDFIYPSNPEADPSEYKMTKQDVGVMGNALVKPLANGKLSVSIDLEVVEFRDLQKDVEGVERPTFWRRKINSGVLTIENGGGISPFVVREDVQHVQEKIPFLGDLPAIGKLFRGEAEVRFTRMLMVQIDVSDK